MQNEKNVVLDAQSISHRYSAEAVLLFDQISLKLHQGEHLAIVGPSGAGKSTLLRILSGLVPPQQGSITLCGLPLAGASDAQRALLRQKKVGFIFQSFELVPYLTVLQNVMLPLELAADPEAKEKAEKMVELVGLTTRSHAYPHQISGGEAQRAACARAFIHQPALVFADEPTGNLDYENADKIFSLLTHLNRAFGTAVVLVTHDRQRAEQVEKVYVLSKGQLTLSERS